MSKKSLSKSKTSVENKVEQVAEQVATEVVEEITMSEEERVDLKFSSLMDSLKEFTKYVRDTMTTFQSELKTLSSQSKKLRRRSRKRVSRDTQNQNGFTKTVSVSSELLKFCGKSEGENMSRNEVNQYIHTYIREHNLQNPENKREIVPDSKLKKILDLSKLRNQKELQEALRVKGVNKGWTSDQLATELAKVVGNEKVNYFNLQRLVNHHYV